MKKNIFIVLGLFISTFAFSEPWKGGPELVERFMLNGRYVKYTDSNNDVFFIPRESIAEINIDNDEIEISRMIPDKDEYLLELPIKKYKFYLDENENLICIRNIK